MASGLVSRKWVMRLTFAVLCLAILFLQLLPLETTPRRWAGPDWLVVLTVAWAARQPKYTPPVLVAALFLLADLLLLRPPGLLAAIMVVATHFLNSRASGLRAATFTTEWLTAAAVMVGVALTYRLGLTIFMVHHVPLGLPLMQVIMNIAIYPLVVFLSAILCGVRRTKARDTAMGAVT
ncbi:rod shape-determining protein MreD [Thiosulfatihalobacter marinus]|jgi:rod shape-determining protein MreD|uniref:rod shape-determining protein MreD n=1 Tax=Thiosulfatihalobacter marinus TaxID=2792481 RepID=UPI0018D68596|nr:rod shape-determining protein MreD [Thiosulfatihalobacter marinus]